MDSQK